LVPVKRSIDYAVYVLSISHRLELG
jgi:hypothetical protein